MHQRPDAAFDAPPGRRLALHAATLVAKAHGIAGRLPCHSRYPVAMTWLFNSHRFARSPLEPLPSCSA